MDVADEQLRETLRKAKVQIKVSKATKYRKRHYRVYRRLLDRLSEHAASFPIPTVTFTEEHI